MNASLMSFVRNKKYQFIFLAAAVFLFIIWAMLYQSGSIGGPDKVVPGQKQYEPLEKIKWGKIEKQKIPVYYNAVGTIRSHDEADIISRLPAARILDVKVRSGDTIKKDDLLVELEDRDLRAAADTARENLKQQESRLAFLEQEFQRMSDLKAKNVVSQQAYDEAISNFNMAKAATAMMRYSLNSAEINLSYASIRSPFDGVVSERIADPGNMATPQAVLIKIFDPDKLEMRIPLRESLVSKIKIGDKVLTTIGSLEKSVEAEIVEIIPSVDPGSRTFQVNTIISGDSSGIMPGMFGRCKIKTGEKMAYLIEKMAIRRVGQLEYLTVKDKHGNINEVMITSMPSDQNGIREVISGVEEGDMYMPRN